MTSRSRSANGTGLSSTPFTTLKIAVLAPMPRASVRMAAVANPGFFPMRRNARRMSWRMMPVRRPGAAKRWRGLLLVLAQDGDGVDARRAANRNEAGHERHGCQYRGRTGNGQQLQPACPDDQGVEKLCQEHDAHEPGAQAGGENGAGVTNNQPLQSRPIGAESQANAELARPGDNE